MRQHHIGAVSLVLCSLATSCDCALFGRGYLGQGASACMDSGEHVRQCHRGCEPQLTMVAVVLIVPELCQCLVSGGPARPNLPIVPSFEAMPQYAPITFKSAVLGHVPWKWGCSLKIPSAPARCPCKLGHRGGSESLKRRGGRPPETTKEGRAQSGLKVCGGRELGWTRGTQ